MTTLADLIAASNGTLTTFEDAERLPAGHFGATAFIDGDLKGYLLEGKLDDPTAVVKGRVEYESDGGKLVANAFAQGGLTGGRPLGKVEDWTTIFAQML